MIDYDFLEKKGIKKEQVQELQYQIMNNIRSENSEEINEKPDADAMLHLSYDLVTQGKLVNVGKFTPSGIVFTFELPK